MSYQVLLVDDENIFLEYLTEIINWEEEKCHICGYAKNGKDALEKIETLNPDIIFMDINMSMMNGLEVCERIKDLGISSRVIIMTAHNEFNFARQAIKLNVFDYLLKPFDKMELLDALHKCIIDIDTANRYVKIQEESYLRNIMESGANECLPASISITQDTRLLISMVKVGKNSFKDQNLLRELLKKYFDETKISNFYLGDENNTMIVAHAFENDDYDVNLFLSYYHNLLNDSKAHDYELIALGSVVSGINKLTESYNHAKLVLENSVKMGEKIVVYDDLEGFKSDHSIYSISDINMLIKCFEMKDYKEVDSIIKKIFGLSQGQVFSFQYVISVYHSLAINVYSNFKPNDTANISDYLVTQSSIIQDLNDCSTTTQMLEIIKNYVYEIFTDCMNFQPISKKENLVAKIEKYLQNHYADKNFTVDQIAENLFFENSYIRRVYKTKTGKTIIQRLEEIRIEKAKEFLLKGEYKHSEISSMAGFSDQYCFSKRFKLICGYTPSDFQTNNGV